MQVVLFYVCFGVLFWTIKFYKSLQSFGWEKIFDFSYKSDNSFEMHQVSEVFSSEKKNMNIVFTFVRREPFSN